MQSNKPITDKTQIITYPVKRGTPLYKSIHRWLEAENIIRENYMPLLMDLLPVLSGYKITAWALKEWQLSSNQSYELEIRIDPA